MKIVFGGVVGFLVMTVTLASGAPFWLGVVLCAVAGVAIVCVEQALEQDERRQR